jgi:hypothetical protein
MQLCRSIRRSTRQLAACLAMLGLVLTQFAAAAIACPLATAVAGPSAYTAAGEAAVADLPCHGGVETPGAACKAHCESGVKNVPAAHQPPLDFVASFAIAASPAAGPIPAFRVDWPAAACHGGSPPHRLSHCVFRI